MASLHSDFALTCPQCRGRLETLSDRRLSCGEHGDFSCEHGIWRLLTSASADTADRFLTDYQHLRRDEGWGTQDAAYYRALPFQDTTGRHPDIWRIRAASFELLRQRILIGARRRVLDLGAGNCWLSWRLAEAGHTVAAVDLSDDATDGLGAATAYPNAEFKRLQASFDRVPLADGAADLAIFNGSLHYSTDLQKTVTETIRLVGRTGQIVIMDSPVYRRDASGERMLEQRREEWRERYGPDFGALPTVGFFTRRRLHRLGAALGLSWRLCSLPLGWRWHLGPLAALALGRREPARFPLIVGQLND